MPIDPAIANPVQLSNPLDNYKNFLSAQLLQSEITKAQNEQNQTKAYNEAFNQPGALGPNGPDYGVVQNYLATHNAGKLIPSLEMNRQKAASDQAIAYKNTQEGTNLGAEALKNTVEGLNKDLDGLDSDPLKAFPQFLEKLQGHLNNPVILKSITDQGKTPNQVFMEDAQAAFNAAKGGKVTWVPYISSLKDGFTQAHERTTTPVNNGGAVNFVSNDKFGGAPQITGSIQMTPTPEQQMERQGIQYTQRNNGATTDIVALPKYPGGPAPQIVASEPMQLTPAQVNAPANAALGDIAKNYINQHNSVLQIPQSIKHIDAALDLIPNSITGIGQNKILDVNRFARLAGLVPANDPTIYKTQELNKFLNKFVLDQFTSGATHARTTNMLQRLTEQSNATGTMEPQALRDLLLAARSDLRDQIKMHNDMGTRLANNPQLSSIVTTLGSVPDAREYGITPAQIEWIRKNPSKASTFDKAVNQPGVAERILASGGGALMGGSGTGSGGGGPVGGGTPTGGRPFR